MVYIGVGKLAGFTRIRYYITWHNNRAMRFLVTFKLRPSGKLSCQIKLRIL